MRKFLVGLLVAVGAIFVAEGAAAANVYIVARDTKEVCAVIPSSDTIIFFVSAC